MKPGEETATDDLAYANEFYPRLVAKLREATGGEGYSRFSPVAYMTEYLVAKPTRIVRGRGKPVTTTQVKTIQFNLELIFTRTSFRDLTDIRLIRRRDITRLTNELYQIPTIDGRPPSQETVRKRIHALSGMLKFAVDQEDLEQNPVNGHPSVPGVGSLNSVVVLL